MSLNRTLAGLIDTAGDVKSASLDNVSAGLTVYATLDDLPTTGLTSGDQAYVSATSRFYISNGSGWYNVALVNATPSLSIDPTGTIELNTDGSTTTITLTGTDSDYPDAALSYSVESDGSFAGMASLSQDSSVFTITPLSEDSATTTESTLTFKASDGISFGSGSRTLTLTFKVVNSNYTTLLLKNEETTDNQVDASTNSYTITEAGNVTSTAFSPYHPGGYSPYFDGNDYISIADGAYKTLGSDPWTYECWVYPTSVAAGIKYILGDHASSGSGATTSANIWLNGANFGLFARTSAGNNINLTESTTRSVNQWYHLALVFDQTNLILYVDGTAVLTQAHSSGFNDGSGSFSVGRTGDYAGAYYTGYVRDVRLVKGTAVYTSSFTPPTAPLTAISGTEILLCHLPYFADGSSNNQSVTIGGDPAPIRIGPYDHMGYTKTDHAGSVYFDGTGDWLTVPNGSEQMVPETGDFTVELWFFTANASTRMDPYSSYTASTGLGIILNYGSGGTVTTYNGNTITNQSSGGQFSANVWNHLAVSRSGTTIKIFINGTAIHTNASDSTDYSGTSTLYIGVAGNETQPYTGYISDVRFVKGTAVYTSDFTPPTAPLTAITNTQLLTCTNKNDIWDAGSGSLLTKYGNVTGGANSGTLKFNKTAIYFDGSGDWIHLPASDKLEPLGNDFTFEWWWYPTTLSQRQWFFHTATDWWLGVDFQNTSGRGLGMWASSNGSSWNLINSDGGGNGISSTNPTLNAWNHIAYTRNGSTFTLWLNGTSIVSVGSITASIVDRSAQSKVIGSWAQTNHQFPIVGYIQDFRVTKGLARYTSSFTPPTAEFDG